MWCPTCLSARSLCICTLKCQRGLKHGLLQFISFFPYVCSLTLGSISLLTTWSVLFSWKAVVLPAKSVAAEDIQFPHAMKPQHHVPLPSSVIFISLLFIWLKSCLEHEVPLVILLIYCIWRNVQVAGERHDKDESAPAFEGLFFNYFSVGKPIMYTSIIFHRSVLPSAMPCCYYLQNSPLESEGFCSGYFRNGCSSGIRLSPPPRWETLACSGPHSQSSESASIGFFQRVVT